jgi:glycosyltransferase involved in cell wall biosynthesis
MVEEPEIKPSLRIAIDASAVCTPRPSGEARYTSRLIRTLLELRAKGEGEHDYRVCYRMSRWKQRKHCLGLADLPRFWYQEPFIPQLRRPRLVHGTDVYVPNWRGVCKVATLHDVFSLISKRWAPDDLRRRKIRDYRQMARRCHRIIAVSEATRRNFLSHIDYPENQVKVVHEGVSARFRLREPREIKAAKARHGLDRPYLLFVGGVDRRKNLLGMMRAMASSSLAQDYQLVVVGTRGHGAEEVLADPVVKELGGNLRLLGFVPDPDLPALYCGASAFCMPSFNEGFGLPLLEAMACGVPVVAAERGAMPEVAGGHAWLAEPDEPAAIAAALERALESSESQREAAQRHARHYSWERCAREVLKLYEEVLQV